MFIEYMLILLMNKKQITIIKEVIVDIKKMRTLELNRNNILYDPTDWDTEEEIKDYTMEKFDIPLVKLNNLLEIKDKDKEVIDIEQQMRKIQAKKYITVKEFTEIYNFSSDWQKNRRSRIHDHLPYQQIKNGGKITYVVSEIETWLENNNSGR